MKTTLLKQIDVKPKWHLIDAKDKVLGRLATAVAGILIGKNKVGYTPSIQNGDCVVLINAADIKLTGKKLDQKIKFTHSGYLGGAKYTPYKKLMIEKPTEAVRLAVKGMLPKNKLGDRMLTRVKIYPGSEHPHEAQIKGESN